MRETRHISPKAGATLLHSVRTAEANGAPLNTFVTINFWQLGGVASTIFHDFADLRGLWFQRWSTYRPRGNGVQRNGPPTYAYVHEAPNGQAHTHWLVHVKPENRAQFEAALRRWLEKRFRPSEWPADALHIQDAENPEGVKLYMAKGLEKRFAMLWNIKPTDCGVVWHRRADTSRNIGPAVWRPLKAAYKARQRRAA